MTRDTGTAEEGSARERTSPQGTRHRPATDAQRVPETAKKRYARVVPPGNMVPTTTRVMPIARDPFAYVSPSSKMAPIIPMPPNQGDVGRSVAKGMLIRPVTAPRISRNSDEQLTQQETMLANLRAYNKPLPCGVCISPDRLYDPDVMFPRGQMEKCSQMFAKPPKKPEEHGDVWAAQVRTMRTKEVGTTAKSHLRAFKSQRSSIIMYQAMPEKISDLEERWARQLEIRQSAGFSS